MLNLAIDVPHLLHILTGRAKLLFLWWFPRNDPERIFRKNSFLTRRQDKMSFIFFKFKQICSFFPLCFALLLFTIGALFWSEWKTKGFRIGSYTFLQVFFLLSKWGLEIALFPFSECLTILTCMRFQHSMPICFFLVSVFCFK